MKTNPARLSGCGADGAGHGIERPTEPATNPEARSSDKVSNFPPEALSMLHWAFGEAVRVSVRLFPEASGAMVKSSSVFGAVPTSSPRLMSPIRTGTASPVGKKLSAGRVPVNLDSRQYASLPQQAGRLGDAESLSNAAVAVAGSHSGQNKTDRPAGFHAASMSDRESKVLGPAAACQKKTWSRDRKSTRLNSSHLGISY